MDTVTLGIYIAHFKAQAFAESQAKALDGELENPVTERMGRHEQSFGFLDGDDIRQALGLRRLDQINVLPGLMQHMRVEEFQTVQIELDGAPRVRVKQIGEVVGQLLFGKIVDLILEIRADAANGPGVGVVSYSLAYIDPTICSKDNGRVLGYDNSHGYHHRHYKGKLEPVDFTSFTELEQRFEMEVRELRNEH
jgi:hypothetical protein